MMSFNGWKGDLQSCVFKLLLLTSPWGMKTCQSWKFGFTKRISQKMIVSRKNRCLKRGRGARATLADNALLLKTVLMNWLLFDMDSRWRILKSWQRWRVSFSSFLAWVRSCCFWGACSKPPGTCSLPRAQPPLIFSHCPSSLCTGVCGCLNPRGEDH